MSSYFLATLLELYLLSVLKLLPLGTLRCCFLIAPDTVLQVILQFGSGRIGVCRMVLASVWQISCDTARRIIGGNATSPVNTFDSARKLKILSYGTLIPPFIHNRYLHELRRSFTSSSR